MKKSILMMLLMIFTASVTTQKVNAQDKREEWPGVTTKVLLDNESVNVSEVTFAPGAIADWHSHPEYTAYAVTDIKMKTEIEGKEATIAEIKAGQSVWSPPVKHRTTNIGKKSFTAIVTEIKEKPHHH